MKPANLILVLLLTLTACAEKKAEDSYDELEASVESGVTVIDGLADDQSNGAFASNRKTAETYAYEIQNLLLPQAWAASCSRAATAPCVSGVKSESYVSCDLPYSSRKLSGLNTLTYSDAACGLSNNGDQVERTYDLTLTGVAGGDLHISSASHTDYRGNSIGGGGRLTKVSGGWQVEVMGKNKSFVRNGREWFNVSARTTAPVAITGSLSRASRVVNGGSYEVIHNKAKFVAAYTPSNLTYSSACCHPISGTMSVAYSGSVNGSGLVTFNGCGSATLEKDGLSRQITLNYCE